MLVLTRNRGESISIGDNIVVKVLDVKGGRARLGIEAPDDVRIVRSETDGQSARRSDETGRQDL